MKIFIDADGCPVIKPAEKIAEENKIFVEIFCDTSHEIHSDYAHVNTVSKGSDSVDFAIVNCISPGDILITQDYGLAAMAISKRARVITQNGLEISDENLQNLLLSRHISKKERRAGNRIKGPKKRTQSQNSAFEIKLRETIKNENTCKS